MRSFFNLSAVSLLAVLVITSCKSVSKYTIDEKRSVKIDTNLLGIWKAAEDTDKKDYILVQSYHDIFETFKQDFNKLGDDLKIQEEFDNLFRDYDKKKEYDYFITRMDHHGLNTHYQQWNAFLSDVKKSRFLNVMYWDEKIRDYYFFVRIIKINAACDTMITAVVADTTLKDLTSSKAVRRRIEKNISNPGFYSDTLHFYKVNGYHLSLTESKFKAN